MTDPVANAKNSFIKSEPVIAAHLAAAVVGYVLTLLVTHGVITHTQASALTQQVSAIVAAGLLTLLGFLVRMFVTPAAAYLERVEAEVQKRLGHMTPSPVPPTYPVPAALPDPVPAAS